MVEAGGQMRHFHHGGEVCTEIEDVGRGQQCHQRKYHGLWVVLAQAGAYATAGGPAEAGAGELYGHHEWGGQDDCPEQPTAELRPGLGVGDDAAGVVVCGARHQPRPQCIPPTAAQRFIQSFLQRFIHPSWRRARLGAPGWLHAPLRARR